ncbi:MAG: LDCC motif putative metal-binding protein [Eubacteriales bacterium]
MIKILKKVKVKLNQFLKKIAQSNEKNFGNHTLDCCELNRKQKSK